MKGLIRKDLFLIKGISKFIMLYIVFLGIFGLMAYNSFVISLLMLIIPMYGASLFTYDDTVKWVQYSLTLPVSRKEIVLSRYASSGLLLGIAALLALIISIFALHSDVQMAERILFWLIGFTSAIILLSVQLPIIYKLGAERGRIWSSMIFVIPIVLISAFASLRSIDIEGVKTEAIGWGDLAVIAPACLIVAVLAVAISITVSMRVFMAKEY